MQVCQKTAFFRKALLCWFLLVMVNVYHHTEISVCGRYYFYVLPCVYQVIANGVKNIGCVSLTLNYSFDRGGSNEYPQSMF